MSLLETKLETPPPNLEWRSSDASTRVSMPIGLADRIAGYVIDAYKSLPRRGAEAGGLLLGGVRLGPVIDIFITGFEPIPCDHLSGPSFTVSDSVQSAFRTAIGRYSAPEILGYYRSHTRKAPGLEASDQEIVDRVFPGLSGLVLLIKPSGVSTLNAGYFFFQTGRLETRPVGSEFPFLVSVPGGTPPPGIPEPETPASPAPPSALPQAGAAGHPESKFAKMLQESLDLEPPVGDPPPPPPPPRRPDREPQPAAGPPEAARRRLQWEIVAAGLMIAAALGLLWWQYRGASGEENASAASAPSQVASLGLTVHPGDGGWRITWNPDSAAARNCVRGVLNISEDSSSDSIPLSAAQVQAGTATYRPLGDDITFRLDLVARDNSLSAETYRVLQRPRETAAAVAPKVKPAPPKPLPVPETAEKATPKRDEPAEPAYVDSEVLNRVAPEIPEGIRPRITSPIPIDVRVSIDREGRVTKASAIQHEDGLVDYLAKRAVVAAQRWTFVPARRAGKPVDSNRTIHFVFEQ